MARSPRDQRIQQARPGFALIHRLKRLESRFRPDYKRPEIVINCVGPNKEVLRTFVLTATGLQERPKG
jgi:hypothetical protein